MKTSPCPTPAGVRASSTEKLSRWTRLKRSMDAALSSAAARGSRRTYCRRGHVPPRAPPSLGCRVQLAGLHLSPGRYSRAPYGILIVEFQGRVGGVLQRALPRVDGTRMPWRLRESRHPGEELCSASRNASETATTSEQDATAAEHGGAWTQGAHDRKRLGQLGELMK
jgi:hypothetical protein